MTRAPCSAEQFATPVCLIVTLCGALTAPERIKGQCSFDWLPTQTYPGEAVFDPALALTTWNDELFVGGVLGGIDPKTGVAVIDEGLAKWNGAAWENVGTGLHCSSPPGDCGSPHNSTAAVTAFTTFQGELIAGGSFDYAGDLEVNGIARWDGSRWAGFGEGLRGCYSGDLPQECDTRVYDLLDYSGQLIAAGNFYSAGGAQTGPIARWDGIQWRPLEPGLQEGWAYAIAEFHGELIVGGGRLTFVGSPAQRTGLAKWDGSTLLPVSGGPFSQVDALALYDGQLVVSGRLGQTNGVATWDGSTWTMLGTSIGGGYPVMALAVFNGELIVAGSCWNDYTSEITADCISRWDGVGWRPFGNVTGPDGYFPNYVAALTVHKGELIAGGSFLGIGERASAGWARLGRIGVGGDWDDDGYVRMADGAAWPTCLSGPASPDSHAITSDSCLCVFNVDGDGDLDLFDFATFQNAFGD